MIRVGIVLVLLWTQLYCKLIKTLTESNLEKFKQQNGMWLIQIAKQPCEECGKEQKDFQNAAQLLDGIVSFAKASASLFPQTIPRNPHYIFYGGNIKNLQQYQGNVNKIQLVKFCLQQIQKTVKARNNQLFGDSKGDKNDQKPHSSKKPANQVIDLNDNNFDTLVLKDQAAWFVEFYSPSCGHCHALQPQWDKLPKIMNERVNIGKVDATKNMKLAQKLQIKGYPTIYLFDTKSKQTPIPYEGQRTAEAMSNWLNGQNIGVEKRELMLLSPEAYNMECNHNIVCLIFLVEKQQKKQLKFLEDLMQKYIKLPLRYFYGSNLLLMQQKLMIEQRSYPKMVSIWNGINSYRIYNQKMNAQDLGAYIEKIMERKKWIKLSEPAAKLIFSKDEQL